MRGDNAFQLMNAIDNLDERKVEKILSSGFHVPRGESLISRVCDHQELMRATCRATKAAEIVRGLVDHHCDVN